MVPLACRPSFHGGHHTPPPYGYEAQLARLKDLFLLGGVDKVAYLSRREQLKRKLAALEAREDGENARRANLAGLLSNVTQGWHAAAHEERNHLARLAFEEVVVQSE